jgi:hypothetical protein
VIESASVRSSLRVPDPEPVLTVTVRVDPEPATEVTEVPVSPVVVRVKSLVATLRTVSENVTV